MSPHNRNPTRYTDTDALHERGIDVDKLDWLPMPDGVLGVLPVPPEAVAPAVGEADDSGGEARPVGPFWRHRGRDPDRHQRLNGDAAGIVANRSRR